MNKESRLDIIKNDLHAATSIATFEATPTAVFRKELCRCIQRVLQSSLVECGPGGVTRYNADLFLGCLATDINWTNLCDHHDRSVTNNKYTSSLSPLQEIVNSLLDPRIIPYALASLIIHILVRAFLHVSTTLSLLKSVNKNRGEDDSSFGNYSRWNPSQSCLLDSLKRVMISRQCREDLGGIICTVYRVEFHGKDPSFHPRKSVLALLKYCMREFTELQSDYNPIVSLFPALLTLFQSAMDADGVTGIQRSQTCRCNCGQSILAQLPTQKRRRRSAFADLADLHGELDEEEQNNLKKTNYMPRQTHRFHQNQSNYLGVTVKHVVNAKELGDSVCPTCQSVAQRASFGMDDTTKKAWNQFKQKCIHMMISLCQSARLHSQYRSFQLVRVSLSVALGCPFLRVCVLQLADTLGRDGYGFLIWSLWELALQKDVRYLSWYAEVIVESSFCDDRKHCWEALQPLVKSVQKLCQETDGESSSCKTLLPCLGTILNRRRRIFQTSRDDICRDFSALIAELSLSFGHPKYWFAKNYPIPNRKELILSLQSLGILSVSALMWDDTEGQGSDNTFRQGAMKVDLRHAYRSMLSELPDFFCCFCIHTEFSLLSGSKESPKLKPLIPTKPTNTIRFEHSRA
jgi:hypothetical protein